MAFVKHRVVINYLLVGEKFIFEFECEQKAREKYKKHLHEVRFGVTSVYRQAFSTVTNSWIFME
jgi:hypothetical protein